MLGLLKKLAQTKQKTMKLELQDIQGILLSGYGHLSQSRYLFLNSQKAAATQTWIRKLVDQKQVTSALWEEKPKFAVNLAITYAGFEQLGAPDELKHSFSPEFRQGMSERERSRRLGDFDINGPSHWEQCWQDDSVHFLLILQASSFDIDAVLTQYQEQIDQVEGLSILQMEVGEAPKDHREHFGFRDGLSQPLLEGSPATEKVCGQNQAKEVMKAGEFILGYLNEDGNYPSTPVVSMSQDIGNNLSALPNPDQRDFGKNGSYFVYRKLEQDVAAFRTYFRDNFATDAEGQRMAAKNDRTLA